MKTREVTKIDSMEELEGIKKPTWIEVMGIGEVLFHGRSKPVNPYVFTYEKDEETLASIEIGSRERDSISIDDGKVCLEEPYRVDTVNEHENPMGYQAVGSYFWSKEGKIR
tara:strand:- start:2171 stop:2503 length:333 start_codon:yes stop_codon:yes gene_type:complete